jgi:hypothetical protein
LVATSVDNGVKPVMHSQVLLKLSVDEVVSQTAAHWWADPTSDSTA